MILPSSASGSGLIFVSLLVIIEFRLNIESSEAVQQLWQQARPHVLQKLTYTYFVECRDYLVHIVCILIASDISLGSARIYSLPYEL